MPRIRTVTFSRFFDVKHDVQFEPVLDRRSGAFVGVAEVSSKQAKEYRGRPGFDVLTDADWLAMTSIPEPDEPEAPTTGNVLTDQASAHGALSAGDLSAPPAPPSGPGSDEGAKPDAFMEN